MPGEGTGNDSVVLTTSDPSSVRFLVAERESFTLKPGNEKPLVEFAVEVPGAAKKQLGQYIISVAAASPVR
jgi:hypothetical protein